MYKASAFLADLLSISLFALLARTAHQSAEMPLSFSGWLSTVWPFALGVLLSWAVILKAGWRGSVVTPTGVATWLITVATGLVIWAIRNAAVPHWSFILVASVTSGLFLVGWRAFSIVKRRRM
ncbi:DUF3054 domain-containing protein [Corynebacterium tapiri]|uniref:DUF3054 domain-containing protein n=1 Tax=Corynebacterium tapiri TaxID=1448266 RepID=A0A5C4U2D1_9CORY|nr:DUF3054 domain-containing protein [Corynebacterium tapiri]TNL94624.1 DUF3054 domain-containing protein [Corynebacterium tapiri]